MQDRLPLDPYFFMRLLLNKIFFSATLFEGFSEGVHKGFFARAQKPPNGLGEAVGVSGPKKVLTPTASTSPMGGSGAHV